MNTEITTSQLYICNGGDFATLDELLDVMKITGPVIDTLCYGQLDHYDEVELPDGLSTEWVKVNQDIHTFIFDGTTNEVVGYFNAMPVNSDTFERIKHGELQDNEINGTHVVPYVPGVPVNIYLMSVALHPGLRQANGNGLYRAFEKLFDGVINKWLRYYNEQGIRVNAITAVGWTNEGKRLCKLLGMDEINQDEFGNPVYFADLTDADVLLRKPLIKGMKKLIATYTN